MHEYLEAIRVTLNNNGRMFVVIRVRREKERLFRKYRCAEIYDKRGIKDVKTGSFVKIPPMEYS